MLGGTRPGRRRASRPSAISCVLTAARARAVAGAASLAPRRPPCSGGSTESGADTGRSRGSSAAELAHRGRVPLDLGRRATALQREQQPARPQQRQAQPASRASGATARAVTTSAPPTPAHARSSARPRSTVDRQARDPSIDLAEPLDATGQRLHEDDRRSGRASANGIPGSPAPEPTSTSRAPSGTTPRRPRSSGRAVPRSGEPRADRSARARHRDVTRAAYRSASGNRSPKTAAGRRRRCETGRPGPGRRVSLREDDDPTAAAPRPRSRCARPLTPATASCTTLRSNGVIGPQPHGLPVSSTSLAVRRAELGELVAARPGASRRCRASAGCGCRWTAARRAGSAPAAPPGRRRGRRPACPGPRRRRCSRWPDRPRRRGRCRRRSRGCRAGARGSHPRCRPRGPAGPHRAARSPDALRAPSCAVFGHDASPLPRSAVVPGHPGTPPRSAVDGDRRVARCGQRRLRGASGRRAAGTPRRRGCVAPSSRTPAAVLRAPVAPFAAGPAVGALRLAAPSAVPFAGCRSRRRSPCRRRACPACGRPACAPGRLRRGPWLRSRGGPASDPGAGPAPAARRRPARCFVGLLGVDLPVDDVLLAERPQVVGHPVEEDGRAAGTAHRRRRRSGRRTASACS